MEAEVLVVDNASSDGTPDMVEQDFPWVTLIRSQSNLGFAKANNIAMRRASGKYIFLINSDVTVPSGCMESMLKYMEAHRSVGILGPKMLTPNGSPGPSCMRRASLTLWLAQALGLTVFCKGLRIHLENFNCSETQDVDVLNGWFWMVRKEALEQVGLLDEQFFMYGEDIDWCRRFWKHGWKVVYFPEAAAVHYGGASSGRAPLRFYIELHRARLKYWKRDHGYVSMLAYVCILWLHQSLRVLGYGSVYLLKRSRRDEALFKVKRSLACLLWLVGIRPRAELAVN
jgi:GT2 family glycosyltransferase